MSAKADRPHRLHRQVHWLAFGLGIRKVDNATWNPGHQEGGHCPHHEAHDDQE
jgi:hypothetical protein